MIEHRACRVTDSRENTAAIGNVPPASVLLMIDEMYRGPIDLQKIERYLLQLATERDRMDNSATWPACKGCGMPHHPSCKLVTP
jgi:hypothetical protein